jgi:ribosomal protein S18 acetylase RimI-like enzyme
VRCLYVELDVSDFESINAASRYGFVIADVRIMFQKDLVNSEERAGSKTDGYEIDFAINEEDIGDLERCAEEMSRVSRFAFDKNFPVGSSEKLYRAWMMNSIHGRVGDRVMIARESKTKRVVGVTVCEKRSDHGRILLVGVLGEHSGRGIASILLAHSVDFFYEMGLSKVRVRTQASNISAQRLYQRNGFLTHSSSMFFHRWIG